MKLFCLLEVKRSGKDTQGRIKFTENKTKKKNNNNKKQQQQQWFFFWDGMVVGSGESYDLCTDLFFYKDITDGTRSISPRTFSFAEKETRQNIS